MFTSVFKQKHNTNMTEKYINVPFQIEMYYSRTKLEIQSLYLTFDFIITKP